MNDATDIQILKIMYIDRNIHNNKSGREKNPDLNMYIHTNHRILEFGHIFEKKLIDSESEWQINYEITTMINKKNLTFRRGRTAQ